MAGQVGEPVIVSAAGPGAVFSSDGPQAIRGFILTAGSDAATALISKRVTAGTDVGATEVLTIKAAAAATVSVILPGDQECFRFAINMVVTLTGTTPKLYVIPQR